MTVWPTRIMTLAIYSLASLCSVYLYLFCPCPTVSTHPAQTPPMYSLYVCPTSPSLSLLLLPLGYICCIYSLFFSLSALSISYCIIMFVCCTYHCCILPRSLYCMLSCMCTMCCVFLRSIIPESLSVPRLHIIHDSCVTFPLHPLTHPLTHP